jgi:hypothetical protein
MNFLAFNTGLIGSTIKNSYLSEETTPEKQAYGLD